LGRQSHRNSIQNRKGGNVGSKSNSKRANRERKGKTPSIVDSCIDWIKEHGFKRVTHANLGAFLIEKNIEIISQTRRALYAVVNMKLRSKSQ
jgi:hypothetical protein